jgi:hypothetical protein
MLRQVDKVPSSIKLLFIGYPLASVPAFVPASVQTTPRQFEEQNSFEL